PPKLKKLRKKELAAKAIDRPNTIWISRRNPPEVSPKARLRPVTMMMITATILATGPSMDSRMDWRGASQGIDEPPARAGAVMRRPADVTASTPRRSRAVPAGSRVFFAFIWSLLLVRMGEG